MTRHTHKNKQPTTPTTRRIGHTKKATAESQDPASAIADRITSAHFGAVMQHQPNPDSPSPMDLVSAAAQQNPEKYYSKLYGYYYRIAARHLRRKTK
jgi:hypothetical protein